MLKAFSALQRTMTLICFLVIFSVFDNMMSFPMRNEAGEMPINDLMRMLQVQPRPADKDSEHQMPIGVNGNNKDMNKVRFTLY